MRTVLVIVGLLVGGCATPYQPMGFSGGYRDRRLSRDQFFIEVRVNSYTSSGTALEYLHRRAQELCLASGYEGYAPIDASREYGEKPQTAMVVQCTGTWRPPAPPPPQPAPAPPRPKQEVPW